MHIIQRYPAFQQEGLKALTAHSIVVETASGITEYTDQGDGPAMLISHGSFEKIFAVHKPLLQP